MTTKPEDRGKVEREARLRWAPIEKMRVSPLAQRELNPSRVNKIAAEFDLEQLGNPTVNERDGAFYVIDGQHRVEALRKIGYGDQQIQCWTYSGLSEEEEAEKFLKLNDVLAVDSFTKYKVGVRARRPTEVEIERVVSAAGLRVSRDLIPGAIAASGTLRRIYTRSGPSILQRTLTVTRDAYGDPGLVAVILDGVALVIDRYGDDIDDETLVKRLSVIHAGVHGVLGRAEQLRQKTGVYKNQCVAASIVEIYNRGKGRRLKSWFKTNLAAA